MALTKISTDGVKDQNVDLTKLPHGDANNDGKFLRANNGADPTYETVSIPAGTTINNNADNRVITGSGSANTLNGESTLTYDGQALTLTSGYLAVRQGSLPQVDIQHSTDTSYSRLYLAQSSGSGGYFAINKIGTNGGAYSGGSNAAQLWQSANAPMLFATNNAERVRILPTGGITFNGDTAAANALDDYETGTWTPSLLPSNGSFSSVTYNEQHGFYVKVGRQVTVWVRLRITSMNSSGASGYLFIQGLPFTVASTNSPNTAAEGGTLAINYYSNLGSTDNKVPTGYSANNSNRIFMMLVGEGSSSTNASVSMFNAANSQVYGCMTYFTA